MNEEKQITSNIVEKEKEDTSLITMEAINTDHESVEDKETEPSSTTVDGKDVDTPTNTQEPSNESINRNNLESSITTTNQVEMDPKNTQEKEEKWPLMDIKEPHENDVLYGRGGGTNHHAGNKRYRKKVEGSKLNYISSKRLDKPLVALQIIRDWRSQDPPGRFLKQDESTGMWNDVGDKKAREKTSQALREKAPQIKSQCEKEKYEDLYSSVGNRPQDGGSYSDPESAFKIRNQYRGHHHGSSRPRVVGFSKTLDDHDRIRDRYTNHSNHPMSSQPKQKLARSVLLRDHSLGRDFVNTESFSLEGFSWQKPVRELMNTFNTANLVTDFSSGVERAHSLALNPLRQTNLSESVSRDYFSKDVNLNLHNDPAPPPRISSSSSSTSSYLPSHTRRNTNTSIRRRASPPSSSATTSTSSGIHRRRNHWPDNTPPYENRHTRMTEPLEFPTHEESHSSSRRRNRNIEYPRSSSAHRRSSSPYSFPADEIFPSWSTGHTDEYHKSPKHLNNDNNNNKVGFPNDRHSGSAGPLPPQSYEDTQFRRSPTSRRPSSSASNSYSAVVEPSSFVTNVPQPYSPSEHYRNSPRSSPTTHRGHRRHSSHGSASYNKSGFLYDPSSSSYQAPTYRSSPTNSSQGRMPPPNHSSSSTTTSQQPPGGAPTTMRTSSRNSSYHGQSQHSHAPYEATTGHPYSNVSPSHTAGASSINGARTSTSSQSSPSNTTTSNNRQYFNRFFENENDDGRDYNRRHHHQDHLSYDDPSSYPRSHHPSSNVSSKRYPTTTSSTFPKKSSTSSSLVRPSTVKRATSNQNEEAETKKDTKLIKRPGLNREHSITAFRLREAQRHAKKHSSSSSPPPQLSSSCSPLEDNHRRRHHHRRRSRSNDDCTTTTTTNIVIGESLKEALYFKDDDDLCVMGPSTNTEEFKIQEVDDVVIDREISSLSHATNGINLDHSPKSLEKPPALQSENRMSTIEFIEKAIAEESGDTNWLENFEP